MDGTAYVIDLWPSISEFAEDIGISTAHARVMKSRNSIHANHWLVIEQKAKARGIHGASMQDLAKAVERQRAKGRRYAPKSRRPRKQAEVPA